MEWYTMENLILFAKVKNFTIKHNDLFHVLKLLKYTRKLEEEERK